VDGIHCNGDRAGFCDNVALEGHQKTVITIAKAITPYPISAFSIAFGFISRSTASISRKPAEPLMKAACASPDSASALP